MVNFEQPFLTIRHDEEQNILLTDWRGQVSSEQFRDGIRKIMDVIQQQNIRLWLSNSRNMNALSITDQRWTNEFFVEALVQSPLKKVARVISDEIMHQLVINNMIEHAADNNLVTIEINQFADSEAAIKWLLTDLVVQ
jgi:hypothetical protein